MKRHLTLVRHAKSDWDDSSLRDFDRPLNARGMRDAPLMARRLKAGGHRPGVIVSSPAKRAWSTALVFAEVLEFPPADIRRADAIYEAPPGRLLDVLSEFNANWTDVMVMGHNPGISQVARLLADGPVDELPTCAFVRIEIHGVWADLTGRTHPLLEVDWPKRHQD